MGSLILKQASLSDLTQIAEIFLTLLTTSSSPRLTLEFAHCTPAAVASYNIAALRAELEAVASLGEEAEAWKVVDGDGEVVVGYAVWGWSGSAADIIYSARDAVPLPEGTNVDLRRTFTGALGEMERRCRPKGKGVYELCQLITSPTHQRRGIGTQLVTHGLQKADRDGVECFLSASPMGAPVYGKLGFEEIAGGRVEVALEGFGGRVGEVHVHVAMVRKARKVEG